MIKMTADYIKEKKPLFIGKNLNYLLAQHSIDIKNLSIETGVPPATISRLRKDGNNPAWFKSSEHSP